MARQLVVGEMGLIPADGAMGGALRPTPRPEGALSSVAVAGSTVLAAGRDGVWRSEDGGTSWHRPARGPGVPYVRWIAFHPDDARCALAGTQPAGVFRSADGGVTWQECPEVAALAAQHSWFLPYAPEAGCVRSFAFHGDRVYAAVEVGGLLRSDDRGGSWRLAGGSSGTADFTTPPAPMLHADVHSVLTHPSTPQLVLAVTAGGLYRSDDSGDTWRTLRAGKYCRAAWVDPADAGHLVLGVADTVRDMNGRIEETHDSGRSWVDISSGLDLPWPHTTVERFLPVGGGLIAVTDDGTAFRSPLDRWQWERVWPEIEGIAAVAEAAQVPG